jgi:hypothetical protein
MIVERRCMRCGQVKSIALPDAGFAAWQAGELIQVALPTVSADDRELLISGICGPCFDAMFPDEDDGDEENPMEDG